MRCLAALISASLALLASTAVAAAADRVYFNSSGISFANLDGSGGGELDTDGASNETPHGIAIDPAAGRIYWANGIGTGAQISVANIDGSGAADLPIEGVALNYPYGVAIDAAAGRIYWSNYQGGATERIAFYDLDGSDKGLVNTTGATTVNPKGVALDPAAGRIYWSNENGEISYAALDGSGGADIDTTGATTSATSASGVAVDRASGRIYWVSNKPFVPYEAFLSYAALDGSGGADLAPGPADGAFPWGVAIDPEAGRVYWANTTAGFGTATIAFTGLDGGTSQDLDLGGAPSAAAKYPTLLKAPVAIAPPQLTAGIATRPRFLICDEGGWAADMPEAQLYRAPRTITHQWLRDGEPVPGGTRPEIGVEGTGGDFSCRVTATNAAGSTSQTSRVQFVCCRASNVARPKARVARVAIVRGGKARLRLRCPKGDGHCSGMLRLLPRRRIKPRGRIGSYGHDLFALGSGKKRIHKVNLNGFAMRLLRSSGNGRLRARVAGTGVQPRPIVLKEAKRKRGRGR